MKNMVTFQKVYSPDEFYENRNNLDMDIYHNFEKKFKKMLSFYKSLSTLNSYRKVQKISIIQTPQTDDTILNLLNKITDANYERISQKLLLKLKEKNLINFINQIFKYSEKSNNNSLLLWNLINYLYKEYVELFSINIVETKQHIDDMIQEYIISFLKEFQVDLYIQSESEKLTKEEYNEFVDRNMNNSAIFAKMKMIYIMTKSKSKHFNIEFTINEIYHKLIDELQFSVNSDDCYKNKLENMNNNILECIFIIICSEKRFVEPFYDSILQDLDDIKSKNNLSSKNKFKLLDIIDKLCLELKKIDKSI